MVSLEDLHAIIREYQNPSSSLYGSEDQVSISQPGPGNLTNGNTTDPPDDDYRKLLRTFPELVGRIERGGCSKDLTRAVQYMRKVKEGCIVAAGGFECDMSSMGFELCDAVLSEIAQAPEIIAVEDDYQLAADEALIYCILPEGADDDSWEFLIKQGDRAAALERRDERQQKERARLRQGNHPMQVNTGRVAWIARDGFCDEAARIMKIRFPAKKICRAYPFQGEMENLFEAPSSQADPLALSELAKQIAELDPVRWKRHLNAVHDKQHDAARFDRRKNKNMWGAKELLQYAASLYDAVCGTPVALAQLADHSLWVPNLIVVNEVGKMAEESVVLALSKFPDAACLRIGSRHCRAERSEVEDQEIAV